MTGTLCAGFDFGTSAARCCVIDDGRTPEVRFESRHDFPTPRAQTPQHWAEALAHLLGGLPGALRARLGRVAICATSGTVLFADATLAPIGPALAYFDARAEPIARELRQRLPAPSNVEGLARLVWLWRDLDGPGRLAGRVAHAMHQADWIAAQLLGKAPATDWHNALKSGADVAAARWPAAMQGLPFAGLLPAIVAPGTDLGAVDADIAVRLGLPATLRIRAGTTDANAAFLATGAARPGQAVTSLGSTLVLKLLSTQRVDAPALGVYSHRWGELWLAGGASNAGGAALRQVFSDSELQSLSDRVDPETDSPLDLYPLPAPGERFPINDPALPPRLTPRPADDAAYVHGLLQALARIEAAGYARLVELGATPPTCILSAGGGARNPILTRLRARATALPVLRAAMTEAAYGVACLAAARRPEAATPT
jgi:sugar (pentulose or hexulose) kinase